MAERNGHDHETRLATLEAARKEMEDTMVVMAHLEAKSAARIKEHAEFIAGQEAAMKLHTQKMNEFDDKLNALINVVAPMRGGMEFRPG
jgi:4'-phosphopantetheinyl transferase EntD